MTETDSVAFSLDGARIITGNAGSTYAPQVWDARTGLELRDGAIPPMPRRSMISPDSRFIARPVGGRVELIPLQPDEEEISYRRSQMQPNYRLYREAYGAARAANDPFAARFYRDRLPRPERTRILAEEILAPLFTTLLLRDDVLAALKAEPAADPEIHATCLKLAGTWPESADQYNNVAWPLVGDPGRPEADYQRGLRLARAACRLEPDKVTYLNTLGVAQYRCGLMAEALATLTRSNDRNHQKEPSDLAFLALAQHRLGQSDKAGANLARLREVMKDPQQSEDVEARAFVREAETIELERVFPADPFAR